jgi:hypothetical protein
MKKVLSAVVVLCVASAVFAAPKASKAKVQPSAGDQNQSQEVKPLPATSLFQPMCLYSDDQNRKNHFYPSGWMGDYSDIRVNSGWTENPHNGKTCMKIAYSAKMSQNAGWAGMYWQQPMSNWGDKKGGYNLTGATKLTFWARGDKGGEKIAEFKMCGITGEFPDSDTASIGPIELTNQWQKLTIDLKGKDLSNVVGGFCWTASKDDNPDGLIMFLDDVVYE